MRLAPEAGRPRGPLGSREVGGGAVHGDGGTHGAGGLHGNGSAGCGVTLATVLAGLMTGLEAAACGL